MQNIIGKSMISYIEHCRQNQDNSINSIHFSVYKTLNYNSMKILNVLWTLDSVEVIMLPSLSTLCLNSAFSSS